MSTEHHYKASILWTGNNGSGTDHYTHYERSHQIILENKPIIEGSSDGAFRGDLTKHTPEDLLLASLSACHMLWYLHLCSSAGVIVTAYTDNTTGTMIETKEGGGRFTLVRLLPMVTVKEPSMIAVAMDLHKKANELCFIANSVNFPVEHEACVQVKDI